MIFSVLFCTCTGKMASSVRDDSSLGLRISGFSYKIEHLWHPGFDLPEDDWDLYIGTYTEIPPAVGPLANYDFSAFRRVNFGMSYQELIDTLGNPSKRRLLIWRCESRGVGEGEWIIYP